MEYPGAAWERAMRLQEVMLKAISGELHWFVDRIEQQVKVSV